MPPAEHVHGRRVSRKRSAEEIILVVSIQSIELILGADAAIQRFAILPAPG